MPASSQLVLICALDDTNAAPKATTALGNLTLVGRMLIRWADIYPSCLWLYSCLPI